MTVERINPARVYDRPMPWILDMDRWPMPWILDMDRWPKSPIYARPWWFLPAVFAGVVVAAFVILAVIAAL